MGFFKDIKNARELAAEHGGMPSMREGLRDARKVFDDNGEREILKTGTPARAIVKGITMQSPTNRHPRVTRSPSSVSTTPQAARGPITSISNPGDPSS